MADFDLGLVLRARDEGAAAAGGNLANTLDEIKRSEDAAANAAGNLGKKTSEAATSSTAAAKAAADHAAKLRALFVAEQEAAKAAANLKAANDLAKNSQSEWATAAARVAQIQNNIAQSNARAAASAVNAGNAFTRSAGQMRQGSLQLGQQIQDVGIQISSGTSVLQTFAMQAGQTGYALSQMGGVAGRIGTFIGNPFVALILAGASILATFAFRSDEAKKATQELGDGIDFAAMSTKEFTKAVGELERAQRKSLETTYESERAKYRDAAASLANARSKREEAKAILEAAIASARGNAGQGTGGAAGAFTGGAADVARAQLAELNDSIAKAENLERLAAVPIIRRRIAAATDEAARATLRYDEAELKLRKTFEKTGNAEAYRDGLRQITLERERATKAAREANKVERETASLPKVTPAEVAAAFGLGRGQYGGTRTPERNRQVRGAANSYHLSGQAVDLPLTIGGKPLTKEAIREKLAPLGIAIKELLGPGDKGHDDHFHVAFAKTRQGADQVAAAAERAAERIQREADALAAFGDRAASSIAAINGRFDEQPTLIDQGARAVRDLDALIAELGQRQPPGFKELIADAEKAKTVVADGIQRPYNDFIASQQQGLQVQRLILQGRQDEADALLQVAAIEKTMGPISDQRKAAILAGVQATRQLARETDLLRAKQQRYLSALQDIKAAVGDVLRDPLEGLKDLPGRLVQSFASLKADDLFEKLFGDTFRQIEDKITGANVAKQAAAEFADAVDRAAASVAKLGNVAEGAATGQTVSDTGEIVVTGRRPSALASSPFGLFAGSIERLARRLGIGDSQSVRDAKLAEALKSGVSIKPDAAANIGRIAGKALDGAATGAMVNSFLKPIGKALGFKTSATGAQIGGAAASLIPFDFPFKKEIGAIVGSVLGGLFKRTKSGSTTITNAFDAGTSTGDFKQQTSALGASIQSSILQIADALGGGLGNFAVSIGMRKGTYRVDSAGLGRVRNVGPTYATEEEAIAVAVRDAIMDGAVTGLSAAVQRALQSSTDIEQGLREALKVQEIETLIGGVGSSLVGAFKRFDAAAAERVRIAKKYGLDVIAVEKINAEQRLQMVEDITRQRIGALKDLQDELRYGDLFEGDGNEKRAALLAEIDKVQKQAEAGSEGAADKLAGLYRELITTSRDNFGTAGGELSSDRALALSGVDKVIAMETKRIEEARDYNTATLAAANQNNVLTNETNDLLAQLIAKMGGGGADMGLYQPTYAAPSLATVQRQTQLSV